jgi:putative MATE family efflux protein
MSNRETTGLTETTERLGYAPLGRLLLSFSVPGIASMITMSLYNIIDTFWLARLGHEAIAALTIILPYSILIVAIGVGTGIGVSSLVSRRFGEGNTEATNYVAGQIFVMSAFFGGIFLAAAVSFPQTILTICGATSDIMDYGIQYLTIIGFGAPFMFFSLVSSNLLRGSGDAIRPMIFMIVASVANIILDPFLIFGIGPFPEMGVRGAALATVIAQSLGGGLSFSYIAARKSAYRIKLLHLLPSLPIIRDIYRVGFPSMITEISESVCFILFNNVLSSFGSLAIAAAGIAIRVSDFAFMPIIGIANGLLPIVGFNFGARIWKRLWRVVKLGTLWLILLMGLTTVIMEFFAPQLIGIFSKEEEMIDIAIPAMRIILSSLAVVGPSIVFITVFQGLGKGREVLLLSLSRQFIFFIPALLLLPRVMGINGAWISIPISDILGLIVSGIWLLREYKLQRQAGLWVDLPTPDTDKKD